MLPPKPEKRKGGRPRTPNRDVLRGIPFVLSTGLPWEYQPPVTPGRRGRLRRRSITPRSARRGVESGGRLGRHRWVVERAISWLNRCRRLRIRYERRADMHLAFLHTGCALICWNCINH